MAQKDLASKKIEDFNEAFTQDQRYLDSVPYLENVKKKGGVVTMCEVADALITEGMEKGRQEGRESEKVYLAYQMQICCIN